MSATSSVAWHRRLSVRLPVLLALALFAFDLVGEKIHGVVFRAFGLPGPGEAIAVMGSGRAGLPARWIGGAAAVTEDLVEDLLSGAHHEAPGRWLPTFDALTRATSRLRSPQDGFLWTTVDLEILAATEALIGLVGTRWAPAEDAPGAGYFERAHPAFRDGELAGWLVTRNQVPQLTELPFTELPIEELPFPVRDAPVEFLDAGEFDDVRRRMELVARGVSFAVILAAAALLGALLSRLITVRLNRLAALAALPLGEVDAMQTGPARVERGRDEISMLDQALRAARAQITELVDKLEERDIRRREWVAQVAHDLRTPLTALLACLERAEDVVEDPAATRDALTIARQDTERVCELVEDLLDAARLEAGAPLVVEPILVGELIDRVARGLGPLADVRGVRLRATVPDDLPGLEGDGRRLLRVLENLVRNALRHAEASVHIEVTRDERWLCLVVKDDGPGFADEATKRDPDSAGLGLIIARRIIDAHGGTLDLQNGLDGGARVVVRLPLA